MAINFSQGVRVGDGGTFFSMPLAQMAPGTYEWLRVSLAYQNYDIRLRVVSLSTNNSFEWQDIGDGVYEP